MQQRVMERELSELRDKLMTTNRSLGLASSNIASQEATITTLRSKCGTVDSIEILTKIFARRRRSERA